MHEHYINPYTDFGFKKLFGTEMNKDLLISFLNALFSGKREEITDVQYLNGEHLGDGYGDRRAVFDVYCQTASGGRFIVEMQKAEQRFFKDRSIYYATAPIREQAPRGKWDYHLEDVTTVGILDFEFPEGEYPEDSMRLEVKLTDVDDGHVFFTRHEYEESVKEYRDYINTVDTAHEKGWNEGREVGREEGRAEGREEGIEENKRNTARSMKEDGLPLGVIAKYTKLSIEEIETL